MKETFVRYIDTEKIKFKYAKGVSSVTGKEFHPFHEIIWFLGGDAELITEKTHIIVKPETLIVIPKETYHQLVLDGDPEAYFRCVINFDDFEEGSQFINTAMKDFMFCDSDAAIKYLFNKIKENTENKSAENLLKSCLILLLSEIQARQTTSFEDTQNEYIVKAIAYINENISQKLTIEQIAAHCNMSVSSLSHLFKREMRIPLHRFILKKRLMKAHHKIAEGEAATIAAADCGFCDYSGFYKQFKKMFGYAPSKRE